MAGRRTDKGLWDYILSARYFFDVKLKNKNKQNRKQTNNVFTARENG